MENQLYNILSEINANNGCVFADIMLEDGTIARGIRLDFISKNEENNQQNKFLSKLFRQKKEILPENNFTRIVNKVNGILEITIVQAYLNGICLKPLELLSDDSFKIKWREIDSYPGHLYYASSAILKLTDGNRVIYDYESTFLNENYEQQARINFIEYLSKKCREALYYTEKENGVENPFEASDSKPTINLASILAQRVVLASYISNALKDYASNNLTLIVKYYDENGKIVSDKLIYGGAMIGDFYPGVTFVRGKKHDLTLEKVIGIYDEHGNLLVETPNKTAETLYHGFVTSGKKPIEILEDAKEMAMDALCISNYKK